MDNLDNKEKEVNTKEDKPRFHKPQRNLKVYTLIVVLVLLLIVSVSVSILLLLKNDTNSKSSDSVDIREIKSRSQEVKEPEEPVVNEEEEKVCPDPIECPTPIEYPKRDLTLSSGGYVSIPDNWYVRSFVMKNRNLSEDEQRDYLDPANYGHWPIYEGFLIEISNNDSTITFGEKTTLFPGGVGFLLKPMDSSWKIVRDPIAKASNLSGVDDRSEFGYAYKNDAGFDTYTIIVKDDIFGGDYVDVNVGPKNFEYKFKGDERYRDIANEIFYKSCVLNSSNLCN